MTTILKVNNNKAKKTNLKQQVINRLNITTPNPIKSEIVKNIKGLLLLANFYLDFRRFLKWSSASNQISTQTNLRAVITMDYHRLEKGLALKTPKVGFGKDIIERLTRFLPEYQDQYGSDETVMITVNALQEYYDFNLQSGLDNKTLHQTIIKIKDKMLKISSGIPDSELVIMMIAVGHLPDKFKVAQSPRKPLNEVLISK